MNDVDPWGSSGTDKNTALSFKNNFSQTASGPGPNILNDQYSQKLEKKLMQLQKKNVSSGKDMLSIMKSKRETQLNNLMHSSSSSPYNNASSMSTNLENPTFFDNLYQTNSIYRHINPQQPLEIAEKIPIVKYDQLSTSETPEQDLNK